MFTNATCVMIGDKEVQSIVTSDGGILYEKSGGGGTYNLTLATDKSSLNVNETATLTATLTNNGVGVQGETIAFEDANETPIIENLVVTTPPDETIRDIGGKWKLIATGTSGYIDIYIPDTTQYIRVKPFTGGYRIINVNIYYISDDNYLDLSGSVLYCNRNILYTDEGDICDLSSFYGQNSFSKMTFIVYTTITILSSLLDFAVTDANGEAAMTFVPTGTGNFTVKASYGNLQDSVQLTVT